MRRPYSRLAAASALAVAIASVTIGPAFAGGNPNAPGQAKKQDAAAQPASQPASQPATQSGSPSQGGNADASQPGMKPANNTAHGSSCQYQSSTTCTANSPSTSQSAAKQDASKHYGTNKTAAQIAASKGVPAGSTIYGPGNSQPHKVTCPGGTKGPDVHAYKAGVKHSCPTVSSTSSSTSNTQNTQSSHTSSSTSNNTSSSTSNNTSSSTSNNTSVTNTAGTTNTAGITSAGGVKGTTTTLGKPKARAAHGGVLGTTAKIRGGRLPFTGFSTWIAALLGIGMILGGAALRARTQH